MAFFEKVCEVFDGMFGRRRSEDKDCRTHFHSLLTLKRSGIFIVYFRNDCGPARIALSAVSPGPNLPSLDKLLQEEVLLALLGTVRRRLTSPGLFLLVFESQGCQST